jgi:hypothetical protein
MFKIIEDLKRSDPQRRMKLVDRMHEKNIAFFAQVNPDMAEFLRVRRTGNFNVKITDKSIEILDTATGLPCHPPGQLFQYMSDFGSWHHTAWIDRTVMFPVSRAFAHGKLVAQFVEALYQELPEIKSRKEAGQIGLPRMRDGRRYSGAVVFLGIMTGLHIMSYLNRTEVRDLFLIEPDLDRFALSTYFLDYTLIEERFGRVLLHVGPEMPQNPVDVLIGSSPVTSNAWIRFLPAYADAKFDDILGRVSLRWRSLTEIYVPYDRELSNACFGMQNLRDRRPVFKSPPQLATGSVIAVVASGPSLENDIQWIKKNRKRMIILAAISAVRILKQNGISPDFQCTLDTLLTDEERSMLQLDREIPLLAYYKLDPQVVQLFSRVFLLPETDKANPVRFLSNFHYTHPTTGNLMAAFATSCRPSKLLLFGLDFGYREVSHSHARGGWHDDDEGAGHKGLAHGREHMPVQANFDDSEGEILTQAYYNTARAGVEAALTSLPEGSCQVFNFADGARIAGANPARSTEFSLPAYPERAGDLEKIEASFSTDAESLWEPLTTPGKQLLEEMAADLLKTLDFPETVDWHRLGPALDVAWRGASHASFDRHNEWRIEIYAKLVHDLLAEWYRCLIFTESPEELEKLHARGILELRAILDGLVWPEELDLIKAELIE